MAQTINTNLLSMNAQRNLNANQANLATVVQRLSSGLRVNSAADDAAGLAIAERMNAQVRGMNVAIRNSNDGISMAQSAEGALGKMSEILQRMRELAVQASNGTNNGDDRTSLNSEFEQLQEEISRVLNGSKFNGIALFDSSSAVDFQVGANNTNDDRVSVSRSDLIGNGSLADAISTAVAVTSASAAQSAIDSIDGAINAVNSSRAAWGAAQNRFQAIVSNLQQSSENIAAARGRIVDADFAQETANLSRLQILQQAGTAMVAQANQLPQLVLQLLK